MQADADRMAASHSGLPIVPRRPVIKVLCIDSPVLFVVGASEATCNCSHPRLARERERESFLFERETEHL